MSRKPSRGKQISYPLYATTPKIPEREVDEFEQRMSNLSMISNQENQKKEKAKKPKDKASESIREYIIENKPSKSKVVSYLSSIDQ
jgi:hypothetical protein